MASTLPRPQDAALLEGETSTLVMTRAASKRREKAINLPVRHQVGVARLRMGDKLVVLCM
jgi:hypothetical protein